MADADELPVTLATFADGSCALGLFPDFLERAGDEHEESELFAALLELLDQHAATL